MVSLGSLQPTAGTKVSIFNRRKPKIKPVTKGDIAKLQNAVGEIVAGKWQAVVDGWAYVIRFEAK